MSQENVEISRRFWTLFNDRDWDAWWSLLDENIEWHARTDKPDVDIYRGHESLRAFVDAWTEMFPDIRVELAGESIDLGEQVITPTLIVGTARTTEIKVRDPYSFLFKIAEGKIVLGQEFHDNAEALKAVGLEESAVSQENVEIVRRGFEAFNAGQPDYSIYHPALVYHPRADEPDPSPHIGREAFERLALGFLEAFSTAKFDVEELIDAGDLVIGSTVMHGRGRASGADVTDAYVFVYRLRDGLIVEGWEYRTRQEALEAVGLTE